MIDLVCSVGSVIELKDVKFLVHGRIKTVEKHSVCFNHADKHTFYVE